MLRRPPRAARPTKTPHAVRRTLPEDVASLHEERIIDFHEEDPTTLNYLRQFKLERHVKRPRLFANDNNVLIELIAGGVGFGTLESHIAAPYIKAGTLAALNRGQVSESPQALIWYPRPQAPAYFKEVLRAIK